MNAGYGNQGGHGGYEGGHSSYQGGHSGNQWDMAATEAINTTPQKLEHPSLANRTMLAVSLPHLTWHELYLASLSTRIS